MTADLIHLPGTDVGTLPLLHKAIDMHKAGDLEKVVIASLDRNGTPQLMYASMSLGEMLAIRLWVETYLARRALGVM